MGAEVQPVVPSRLGLDPTANAARRFEDEDVAVTELPGRRQTGDSGAADDRIAGAVGSPSATPARTRPLWVRSSRWS
jgi:hypothetical protein